MWCIQKNIYHVFKKHKESIIMKKIYIAIVCIALTITLLGCDEKKAKDDITKALDNAITAKPTKPVLSSYRVRVGEAATFTKATRHTYVLENATSNVTLSDVPGDTTKKQVSSTVVESGIVVVATFDGDSIKSDPIEFFMVKVANKAALQTEITTAIARDGNKANLNYIDTSEVTDMSRLFNANATFNGDISKWDTSSVTNMSQMFNEASAFNQNLNSWDVSNVQNMFQTFADAKAFNQPLNNWDVSSVTDMDNMFYGATSFNQDISGWVKKDGGTIFDMFFGATAMNANPSNKPSWAE